MPPKASTSKPRANPSAGPPKMRSSCEACAESKIGCTKERPTCSRCEKRGISCVYVVTKRAGRPTKNKQRRPSSPTPVQDESATNPERSVQPSESPTSRSSCAGWSSDMTDTTMSHSTMTDPPMPETIMTDSASAFTSSSISQQTLGCRLPDYSDLFDPMATSTPSKDGFVSSLLPLSQPLSQLLGASPQLSLFDDNRSFNWDSFLFQTSIRNDTNSFHDYEKSANLTQDLWNSGLGGTNLNDGTSLPLDSQRIAATPADSIDWFAVADKPESTGQPLLSAVSANQDCFLPTVKPSHDKYSSRGCLARCLYLLDQLTPQWTTAPCTQNTEKDPSPMSVSFESVMTQNQTAIDAIEEMLNCSCSRNSALLFTIALVIFKMLGWYAACANAASHTPSGHKPDSSESGTSTSSLRRRPPIVSRPLHSTLKDYEMDGDYEDRIVCQIVLSRLHNVLHTLNVLTQRLTESEEKPGTTNSSAERVAAATLDLLLNGPAFNASSPSSLGQSLASNLRWHLQDLCENIVSTLSGA